MPFAGLTRLSSRETEKRITKRTKIRKKTILACVSARVKCLTVTKYCNEHVCVYVCVCLCLCVSVCPRARLPNLTCDLYQFLRMLPMAVARHSSGGVTKSQGKGQFWGLFFPTDKSLYSIAFGTHTKTVEPIEMPFGMMTRVGPRYHAWTTDHCADGCVV